MRSRQTDCGAAAVEFALVLPILVLLICGIVDFGRFHYTKVTLAHAAREGARVWAVSNNEPLARDRATQSAAGVSPVTVTLAACSFGQPTSVTVGTPFSFITPLITDMAPAVGTITAQGVMRCER